MEQWKEAEKYDEGEESEEGVTLIPEKERVTLKYTQGKSGLSSSCIWVEKYVGLQHLTQSKPRLLLFNSRKGVSMFVS